MDENYCIPDYKVVDADVSDKIIFEYEINELAKEGYVVQQITAGTNHNYLHLIALLVRSKSRLEVLIKDGEVVK